MKTIKIMLGTIFILLLTREITYLAYAFDLRPITALTTRLIGAVGASLLMIYAVAQDRSA